jgi:hypothetical protein
LDETCLLAFWIGFARSAWLEQLERHPAVEVGIVGAPYDSHSTLADPIEQDITSNASAFTALLFDGSFEWRYLTGRYDFTLRQACSSKLRKQKPAGWAGVGVRHHLSSGYLREVALSKRECPFFV